MISINDYFEEIEVSNWGELISVYNTLPRNQFGWILRGHRSAECKLTLTVERTLCKRGRG